MQMPQPDDALCAGYKIVRRLAQGSCTTVYEARPTHPKLRDRPVTLKVLRHYGDPRHFMQAARINAALR